MVPTRYGSSEMHSSTRPQRGSRMTSSTGARPWWMPRARIDAPISGAHLLDERGVEGRAPGQRRREGGGGPGGQPGEALLVHQRRDAQPGLGAPARAASVPQPRGPLHRVDRSGAVRPGQVAQAVPRGLLEPGRPAELALERRDGLAVALVPEADDLGELLLQRHPAEQVAHAVRRGGAGRDEPSAGVVGGRGHGRVLGAVGGGGGRWSARGARRGHPFTAPWSPLTIRLCMARKKTSAGIIARVVNAKTPAVSEEYCEEKSATPSGSVFMSPCSRSSGSR